MGGFPKSGIPFVVVPIIRAIVSYFGVYVGVSLFMEATTSQRWSSRVFQVLL